MKGLIVILTLSFALLGCKKADQEGSGDFSGVAQMRADIIERGDKANKKKKRSKKNSRFNKIMNNN